MSVSDVQVSRLNYAIGGEGGRPTLLTAAGAMSIIVALAAMAASGWVCYVAGSESLSWEETSTPAKTWYPPAAPLSPVQIAAVLQEVKDAAASPTQLKAMQDYLASQNQSLFYPEDPRTISRQIHSISIRGTVVELLTFRGRIAVAFNGRTYLKLEPQAYSVQRRNKIDPTLVLASICAGLSAVLGVVLLVAGIAVLRRDRRARALHLWYARLKIVLAICAAAVCLKIGTDPDFWFGPEIGALMGLGVGVIGAIYPIVLLIVMRRRTVRDYCASLTPA